MIDGVMIKELQRIPDERGKVLRMFRSDENNIKFGEVYVTAAYPKMIKAWHGYDTKTLMHTVVSGMMKLVLFDARPYSSTYKNIQEIFMGDDNYCRVTIPPRVFNGLKCISTFPCIDVIVADEPFYEDRIIRWPHDDKRIGYDWNKVYK